MVTAGGEDYTVDRISEPDDVIPTRTGTKRPFSEAILLEWVSQIHLL